MRRFLSIFLVIPFTAFAGVVCTIEHNVNGQATIVCVDDSSNGGSVTNLYFTESACNDLIANLNALLADIVQELSNIDTDVLLARQYITMCDALITTLREDIISHTSELGSDVADDCLGNLSGLSSLLSQISSQITDIESVKATAVQNVERAQSYVGAYDCSANSNLVCNSSGGVVGCPCQDQFASILELMGRIHQEQLLQGVTLTEIKANGLLIHTDLVTLTNQVGEIIKRLNSPDDRMWGEVMQIYTYLSSNVNETVNGSLNLYQIFEKIRQKITDINDATKMNLSTEGVISLNNMVANMANLINSQYNNDMVWTALHAYTNIVLQYFESFNNIQKAYATSVVPAENKYLYIYDSMTNDSISARNRYARLVNRTGAQVTNWFQRIEFYLQGLNGWFDDPVPDGQLEKNNLQENTTDEIFSSLNETTNSYGTTIIALSNAYSKVESLYSPVLSSFDEINIAAELPSVITFFPEIEVFNGATFGPVELETSEITEYIDVARNATTLFWKVSIWVLYILLGVGGTRLLFILVMFIVHIAKDL